MQEEKAEERSFVDQVFESEQYIWDPVPDDEKALQQFHEGCPIHETLRSIEGRKMLRDHLRKKQVSDSEEQRAIQLALSLHAKKQREKRKRLGGDNSANKKSQ